MNCMAQDAFFMKRIVRVFILGGLLATGLLFCSGCASEYGVATRKLFLEQNAYNQRYKMSGPMYRVTTITVHNTANKGSAQAERDYLNRRTDKVSVSFHFAVDENEVVQILPLNVHAWHAGDGKGKGNMESIAVEICRSTHPDQKLYRKAEANAVKLIARLLVEYGLSPRALRMHKDWSGKHCPHRILDERRWPDFVDRVTEEWLRLKKR